MIMYIAYWTRNNWKISVFVKYWKGSKTTPK